MTTNPSEASTVDLGFGVKARMMLVVSRDGQDEPVAAVSAVSPAAVSPAAVSPKWEGARISAGVFFHPADMGSLCQGFPYPSL